MGRMILVSNRLPVTLRRGRDGAMDIVRSSGGLVAALGPIHEAGDGLWIGNVGDQLEPDVEKDLSRRRYVAVPVSNTETRGYYYGYSNSAVWPLFHYMPERAKFDRSQFETYRAVNQRFADQIVESYRPGDTIWVQDYQLMLVPCMVRERLPDARIGFFLHIPFPSSEMFRVLPERDEIVRGLLGANVIGFHTYDYARHFISAVLRTLGIHMREGIAQLDGHRAEVGTFPIGIDTEAWRKLAVSRAAENSSRELRSHFGDRRILLGVERLDYTKGIPHRIRAIGRFFEKYPEYIGNVVFVQAGVMSRANIDAYKLLSEQINQELENVNGRFSNDDWQPIIYLPDDLPAVTLAALRRIARFCIVSSLHDGMNLVAKEFVASRFDEDGVLILSPFTGSALELTDSVIVNPYATDQFADAIREAVEMPYEMRKERMVRMRSVVEENNIYMWAARIFVDLMQGTRRSRRPIRSY